MNDIRTEFLQVRCTPEMKQKLEAKAAGSVSSGLADHIRFALAAYLADGLPIKVSLPTRLKLELAIAELETAFGVGITELEEAVLALLRHWDITKRDCYGTVLRRAELEEKLRLAQEPVAK
jgi:hypothetical protein